MQQGGGDGMKTMQAGRDPAMMRDRGMMRHCGMGPNMMTMMMVLIDTDGSGTLSLEEVQAVHARMFQYVDSDDDGELTPQELRGLMSGG